MKKMNDEEPWRQAIEVSFQLLTKLGIGDGLVVAGLEQAVEDVVLDIGVGVAGEGGAWRRVALSDAFSKIHRCV